MEKCDTLTLLPLSGVIFDPRGIFSFTLNWKKNIRKFPSVNLSEILSRFWCFLNFSNRLGSFCVKNRKPLGSFSTPKSKKLRYQLQLIKTPLIHLIIHCMHVFTIGRVCRKVGWLNLALGAVMTTWWNQLLVPLWSQTSCSKQTVCLAEVVAYDSLHS